VVGAAIRTGITTTLRLPWESDVLARLVETLRDCGLDVGESPLTVDEAAERLTEWAKRAASPC